MKYVIYEMVQPDHLQYVARESYGYTKTVYRDVLEKLDVHAVVAEHPTMESAVDEIQKNAEVLKTLRLTILPVVSVSWEGKIS